MVATTVQCDGVGCAAQEPAAARDGQRHGWIEVAVDGETRRFCSWDCLATHAHEQMKQIAGD